MRVLFVLFWIGVVAISIFCILGALFLLSLFLTGVDWIMERSRTGKKGV